VAETKITERRDARRTEARRQSSDGRLTCDEHRHRRGEEEQTERATTQTEQQQRAAEHVEDQGDDLQRLTRANEIC
jgi:hypothetical protein